MSPARGAGRSGRVAVAALLVLAASAFSACGDGGTAPEPSEAAAAPVTVEDPATAEDAAASATGDPALCEDVEAVRESVETMRGATVGDGAVAVVAEELQSLETTLPELRSAAAEQYATQVAAVETGMAAVRTSVEAAQADTSAATLLAVTTSVQGLGATVDGLVQDVGDTC